MSTQEQQLLRAFRNRLRLALKLSQALGSDGELQWHLQAARGQTVESELRLPDEESLAKLMVVMRPLLSLIARICTTGSRAI